MHVGWVRMGAIGVGRGVRGGRLWWKCDLLEGGLGGASRIVTFLPVRTNQPQAQGLRLFITTMGGYLTDIQPRIKHNHQSNPYSGLPTFYHDGERLFHKHPTTKVSTMVLRGVGSGR